jgi:hypothetical protein
MYFSKTLTLYVSLCVCIQVFGVRFVDFYLVPSVS